MVIKLADGLHQDPRHYVKLIQPYSQTVGQVVIQLVTAVTI